MSHLSCKPYVAFTIPTPPLPSPPTIPPKKVHIFTGSHKENMPLVIKTESFIYYIRWQRTVENLSVHTSP